MPLRYQPADNTLSTQQLLMLASLSMNELGWQYRIVDNTRIMANPLVGDDYREISIAMDGSELVIATGGNDQATEGLEPAEQLIRQIETNTPAYTPDQLDEKWQAMLSAQIASSPMVSEIETSTSFWKSISKSYITLALAGINLVVFIAMVMSGISAFSPTAEELLSWGGNSRVYTENGQGWRLITSTFVHIGVVHLVFNMYALIYIGMYLEPFMGRWRMLAAYLSTGLFASLTSIFWHTTNTVAAGASGAIFGLYGLFIALMLFGLVNEQSRKSLLASMVVFVCFNLLYGMREGIDNAAHIGGLLSGFGLGYVYLILEQTSWKRFFVATSLLLAISVSAIFLSIKNNDNGRFNLLMIQIGKLEAKALVPLSKLESLSPDEFVKQSTEVSLPAWFRARNMLEPSSGWLLTGKVERQRAYLVEYVNLRIKFTEMLMDAVRSGEEEDWQAVNRLAERIQHISSHLQLLADG